MIVEYIQIYISIVTLYNIIYYNIGTCFLYVKYSLKYKYLDIQWLKRLYLNLLINLTYILIDIVIFVWHDFWLVLWPTALNYYKKSL